MKTILNLRNPLWETAQRRAILDKVVQQSAAELESRIKQKILNSIPAGKVYRRGRITRAVTKRLKRIGYETFITKKGRERAIVGERFHRASAIGQPPAIDSGKLLRSIKVKRTGELQMTVFSDVKYAAILDNPKKLNRPFAKKTRDSYRAKFKRNLLEAIKESIKNK